MTDPFHPERAEVERASRHYYHTPQQTGIDNRTRQFVIDRCLPHILGSKVLELGYVDGLWTDALVENGFEVDIVEGASHHVEYAQARHADDQQVQVFHNLFQEFTPSKQYNTLLAGDMIRYVAQPELFLAAARDWVVPGGRLVITVPNSRSLHRRIGALMNLEPTPTAANTRDQEVGNQRAYDRYELRTLLLSAGWRIDELHGCFLKPLSSTQMEDWSDALLRAFFLMGDELEDYCWFLYAVCTT